MKSKDLEKLFLEHTKDGVTDFEAISNQVNEFTNSVVVKNAEKVKQTTVSDFVKSLGLENVADEVSFKSYVDNLKLSESEKDKLIADYTKKLEDEATARAEYESKYGEASSKLTSIERKDLLRSKGLNPVYLDDIMTIANTRVSDDKPFDKVIDELLAEERYSIFREQEKGKVPKFSNLQEKVHLNEQERAMEELRKL
jgi:hypothetical protein